MFTTFGVSKTFREWYLFSRLPSQPDLGPDSAFCFGDTLTLEMGDQWWANATNVNSFQWSDGSTDTTLDVTTAGNYWVEVFNDYCSSVDSINTFIIPEEDSLHLDS